MLIEHNTKNFELKTSGNPHANRHGLIYVTFDLPIVGLKTYKWEIHGSDIEDIRHATRIVKDWAFNKADSLGDIPYRVTVE